MINRQRIKKADKKAKKLINNWNKLENVNVIYNIGFFRKTRKKCSCFICSHKREIYGLTLQELRDREDVKQQLEELWHGKA